MYASVNLVKIGSDNVFFFSIRRQAIIYTNAGVLPIDPLEQTSVKFWTKCSTFHSRKCIDDIVSEFAAILNRGDGLSLLYFNSGKYTNEKQSLAYYLTWYTAHTMVHAYVIGHPESNSFHMEPARYPPETIKTEGKQIKSSSDPPQTFQKQACWLTGYFRLELRDQPGVYIKHNGVNALVGVASTTENATCFRTLHIDYVSPS